MDKKIIWLNRIFVLVFLVCVNSFSQKRYEFDHLLEYSFKRFEADSITKKSFFLTNSKDNSYSIFIIPKEEDQFSFNLFDINGNMFNVYLKWDNFVAAEFITVDCKFLMRYMNNYSYQKNNYEFIIKKDTIIDNHYSDYYYLKSNKPKWEKRKKLRTHHFIIDKSTNYHLPLLRFSTALNTYQKNPIIPNGIFKEKYMLDYNEKEKKFIYQLISIKKINKTFIIPKECNYSD